MKIGSVPRMNNVNPYTEVARKNKIAAQNTMGTDKAEFSENARLFAATLQAAKDIPEVRTDRVNALKEQIDSGSYHVAAEDIAEKLLTRL